MSKTIAFACRVVVMLTFLIAIPLIALFGKSLPNVAGTVWEYWQKPQPEENAWADAGEAPLYSPETMPEVPQYNPPQPLATHKPSPVNPATFIAPANRQGKPTPPNGQQNLPYIRPNMASGTTSPNAGRNASMANRTPINTQLAPRYGNQPLVPVRTTPRSTPQPSQMQTIEDIGRRLKQLGATDYRLEYWGNQYQLFRCHCRMPVAGNPSLTQQFEATDKDSVQAMLKVLHKIESWRAAPPHTTAPRTSNGLNTPR